MLVDIGIPSNKVQSKKWWPELVNLVGVTNDAPGIEIGGLLTTGSAMDDFSKNSIAKLGLKRSMHTDMNRSQIVEWHREGKADAIFWLDDDTTAPADVILRLAKVNVPIAAGLYFMRRPPCNPIAYYRVETGLYRPLWDYQRGEILKVDSVGMGCTLVWREVYETIMRQYVLFRRMATGVPKPVHRDDIIPVEAVSDHAGKVVIHPDGILYLEELAGPIGVSGYGIDLWPFYAMEYGRTEDHHFCEMAKRCGFEIVVDTSIECKHWGEQAIGIQNFLDMHAFYEEQGKEPGDESA